MTTMLTRPPATSPATTKRRRGRTITKLREPGREYNRVVIYLRISRDLAGDHHGVEDQENRARRYVESRGWTLVECYVENNVSASDPTKERPKFGKMLGHVLRGECDMVLAVEFSRLVRMSQDFVTFGYAVRDQHVKIVLLNGGEIEPWTAGGWAQMQMHLMHAEQESMYKSDRQVNANQARARKGKPHKGGARAFGYKAGGEEIEPAEAAAVEWAYKHIESGGSVNEIVRRWTAQGFNSGRANKRFTRTAVRQILLNPRNAGHRAYWYETFTDEDSGEIVQGTWPAIVSPERYDAVRAILEDRGRYTSPGPERKHLLSGLMRCGVCAERGETKYVQAMCRSEKGVTVPIYGCQNGSKHLGRTAARVDRIVMDTVLDYIAQKASEEMLAVQRPDVDGLREERERRRARKKMFAAKFLNDLDADPADYEEAFAENNRRLRELDTLLTDNTIAPAVADLVTAVLGAEDDHLARMAEALSVWENYDLGQRRALIDAMATVTLYSGRNAVFDPTSVVVELKR